MAPNLFSISVMLSNNPRDNIIRNKKGAPLNNLVETQWRLDGEYLNKKGPL